MAIEKLTKKTGRGGAGRGQGRHVKEIKRDKVLSVRLTEQEKEKFCKAVKKAGLSQADFIVSLVK